MIVNRRVVHDDGTLGEIVGDVRSDRIGKAQERANESAARFLLMLEGLKSENFKRWLDKEWMKEESE